MTNISETIEALERALIALEGKIRSDEKLASHYPDAKPSNIARKRKADAARLDALAKALVDLTSEGWWVKQTGEAGDADCADVVRLRLEKP